MLHLRSELSDAQFEAFDVTVGSCPSSAHVQRHVDFTGDLNHDDGLNLLFSVARQSAREHFHVFQSVMGVAFHGGRRGLLTVFGSLLLAVGALGADDHELPRWTERQLRMAECIRVSRSDRFWPFCVAIEDDEESPVDIFCFHCNSLLDLNVHCDYADCWVLDLDQPNPAGIRIYCDRVVCFRRFVQELVDLLGSRETATLNQLDVSMSLARVASGQLGGGFHLFEQRVRAALAYHWNIEPWDAQHRPVFGRFLAHHVFSLLVRSNLNFQAEYANHVGLARAHLVATHLDDASMIRRMIAWSQDGEPALVGSVWQGVASWNAETIRTRSRSRDRSPGLGRLFRAPVFLRPAAGQAMESDQRPAAYSVLLESVDGRVQCSSSHGFVCVRRLRHGNWTARIGRHEPGEASGSGGMTTSEAARAAAMRRRGVHSLLQVQLRLKYAGESAALGSSITVVGYGRWSDGKDTRSVRRVP